MPKGDPWDGFFYPTLTLMIDSYSIIKKHLSYWGVFPFYNPILTKGLSKLGQLSFFLKLNPQIIQARSF